MAQVGAPLKQLIPFTITVTPGSTPAAPASTDLVMPDSWVHAIEVEVPPGPGGSMGFNITYGDTQIIPWSQASSWLIVDNYSNSFDVEAELGSGLKLVAYNTGHWDHSIYLRVKATPISAYLAGQGQAPVQPLDLSSIGG